MTLFQMDMDRHCSVEALTFEYAYTVEDAIQGFNPEEHCAVLIDWHLPDGDGIDVAQYIRSLNNTLPIVFLSSALTEDQLQIANKYNAKACLIKGYGKAYVDTLMEQLLVK